MDLNSIVCIIQDAPLWVKVPLAIILGLIGPFLLYVFLLVPDSIFNARSRTAHGDDDYQTASPPHAAAHRLLRFLRGFRVLDVKIRVALVVLLSLAWFLLCAAVIFRGINAPSTCGSQPPPSPPPTSQPSPGPGWRPLIGDISVKISVEIPVKIGGNTTILVQNIYLRQGDGPPAQAQLQAILLFDRASWAFGKSDSFVDGANKPIPDISQYLDSDVFAGMLQNYQEIWALGLVSGTGNGSEDRGSQLSNHRATELSQLIWDRSDVTHRNICVRGLSLGVNNDHSQKRDSIAERRQRSVVLIGIRNISGKVDTKKAITELLVRDEIKPFKSSVYSDIINVARRPLTFIVMTRDGC